MLPPSRTSLRLRHLDVPSRSVVANITARLVAVVALGIGTIVVARSGGAADVGVLALLRVLPGLAGVLAACGLPGAMGYFLAGPFRSERGLWPTVLAILAAGMAVGAAGWLVLTPLIRSLVLPGASATVMVLAAVSVATQLPVAAGKAGLQGLGDQRAANVVTAAEEAAFLPAFALFYLLGYRGPLLLVIVLVAADVIVAVGAWARLASQVHRRGMRLRGRPDAELARRIVSFGIRGQVGGLVGLLNLRLDFIILGSLAGPGPLGVYAVASKFAELVKVPALALTWVSYPRIARLGPVASAPTVRRQVPRLLALGIVGAAGVALAAGPLLPTLYGREFVAAVLPGMVIVAGLAASPAGGLASGYLLGTSRPGLNSLVQGIGLLVTLGLDLLLIPSFGILGAAVASAVAYLLTDVSLLIVLHRFTRGLR